jgi:hypothetical protein
MPNWMIRGRVFAATPVILDWKVAIAAGAMPLASVTVPVNVALPLWQNASG